jgi:hypothetical protein
MDPTQINSERKKYCLETDFREKRKILPIDFNLLK